MIGAIETIYDGHRFRSRLEARWAVFFNEMNIPWLYEPEGFQVGKWKYLPDFYLPKSKTWVEVKGGDESLRHDIERLEAVLDFDSPIPYMSESRFDGSLNGLLILGNIPRLNDKWSVMHPIIQHHKGLSVAWITLNESVGTYHDYSDPRCDFNEITLEPRFTDTKPQCSLSKKAYNKARMARFEHGEKP